MFYNLDNINIEEINLPKEPVATKQEKKVPKKVSWVDQQCKEKLLTNILSGKSNEITLTVEDFIKLLCLFSQQKKAKKLPEINFVFEHLDLIKLWDYFQLKIEDLVSQLDKQTIKNANQSIRNIDQMITEVNVLKNQIKTDCEQKPWDF